MNIYQEEEYYFYSKLLRVSLAILVIDVDMSH